MAEQTSIRNVVWDKFTQVPSSPEIGENPITKVLNMELSTHKTVRTRRGFGSVSTYTGTPENQIVTSLMNSDDPLLIYKSSGFLYHYDGISGPHAFSPPATIHYTGITADTDGTFSVYGGELYYCESSSATVKNSALFAWNGSRAGGFRNLGVPGMTGKVPDTLIGKPATKTVKICSARTFDSGSSTDCGCACAGDDGTEFFVFAGGDCVSSHSAAEVTDNCPCPNDGRTYMECARAIPGAMGIFCWSIPASCGDSNEGRGEKILNCAFRVGLYDPKRNIYGRACDPKAVINFGRTRGQFAMYQYQILVDLNDFDRSAIETAGYRIAVWCTTGIEVLDFKHWKNIEDTGLMLTGNSHAMSDFLGGQTFLEGIYNAAGGGNPEIKGCSETSGEYHLCLYKDQTLLGNSPPYNYMYERPIPSKAMCVLGNMALYFYPIAQDITQDPYIRSNMTQWATYKDEIYETFNKDDPPSYRFGAEYSVGHPEQIGRYTDAKDTFTPLPYLKGDPVRIFNDAGTNIMLTRQGAYSIGFNNGAQLQDLGGPGIITGKSYHPTSSGVMYVADEGPIWLQGGKPVPIIRQLGFDGWFDDLSADEKKEVRIGFIEDSKKILISLPIPGTNGRYRYLMHDVETSFTSEWWIGAGQKNDPNSYRSEEFPGTDGTGTITKPVYMSSFRSNYGYKFLLFASNQIYKYDEAESISRISVVEMWINENSHLTKQIKTITADLGSCDGGLIIRVSTFDSPRQFKQGSEEPTETRILSLGYLEVKNRMLLSYFMGMRGKYIRIRFETEDSIKSRMEISKISTEVKYDDAPSSLGEPPIDRLTPA